MARTCKATLSPLHQLPSLLPTKKSNLPGENPSILVLFLPPGIKLLPWEWLVMGGCSPSDTAPQSP